MTAERDGDAAVRRAREQGGHDPDFLTLALIAAVTLEITEHDLVGVLDAAISARGLEYGSVVCAIQSGLYAEGDVIQAGVQPGILPCLRVGKM